MSNIDAEKTDAPSKFMHYGMMACCAVMLLPVAAFFLAGGSIAQLWTNLGIFAPIALCIGVHLLMFKMMGKSCHGTKNETDREAKTEIELSRIPAITRDHST
ncbi:DUF2933 domain-containing protein [Litoreibacter arenae]|uniref:DUF2933 domain-containing protein n=1 Tax=Litoreibacter arenae TaxID=491388 RepID=UPI0005939E3B|nr:DUF2933 domain-containing protein [Litoreibacter arenae]